jgi:hypothetical protein
MAEASGMKLRRENGFVQENRGGCGGGKRVRGCGLFKEGGSGLGQGKEDLGAPPGKTAVGRTVCRRGGGAAAPGCLRISSQVLLGLGFLSRLTWLSFRLISTRRIRTGDKLKLCYLGLLSVRYGEVSRSKATVPTRFYKSYCRK